MHRRIRNDECLICEGSLLKGLDLYRFVIDDCICYNCRKNLKAKFVFTKFDNYPLISFFEYSEEISQLLIKYKDFFDKSLADIFLKEYMWLINILFKDFQIIIIPSSKSLEKKRGFNHLEKILDQCKLEVVNCLVKTDQIQRFNKARHTVFFSFKYAVSKFDKIIIFDDVITSGSSMREAIRLLAPISNKIVLISITTNKNILLKKGDLHARKS